MDPFVPQARHACISGSFNLCNFCTSHYLLCNHMLPAARVAFRNKTSTLIRLVVAPFLFILLVYVIDKAISSGNQSIAGNNFLSCEVHRKATLLDSLLKSVQDVFGVCASSCCQCHCSQVILQRTAWSRTLLPTPSVLLHLVRVTCIQCPHVGTSSIRPTTIRWQKPLLPAFRQTTLAELSPTARCA